jgi:hypothetical protein
MAFEREHNRSRSVPYESPDASHSLGYMLMVVKPGIVFTSLTNSCPVSLAMRKSTRDMPEPSTARKALIANCWTSVVWLGVKGEGISSFESSSRYLAS